MDVARVLVLALLLVLAVVPWYPPGVRAISPAPAADPVPGGKSGSPTLDPRAMDPRARHARALDPPAIDPAVLLDLAAAALAAGASVPGALIALGEAVGGAEGRVLRRAGAALLLGGSWPDAWGRTQGSLGDLARALEPAWVDGVPATPLLQTVADRIRADRSREAQEAAARLGVRLVLPLGLCFLPAFVLLGLVPVLLSAGIGLLG